MLGMSFSFWMVQPGRGPPSPLGAPLWHHQASVLCGCLKGVLRSGSLLCSQYGSNLSLPSTPPSNQFRVLHLSPELPQSSGLPYVFSPLKPILCPAPSWPLSTHQRLPLTHTAPLPQLRGLSPAQRPSPWPTLLQPC